MKNLSHWWIFAFFVFVICFEGQAVPIINQEAAREKLLNLLSGEWVSRAVYVATKLEIADHLQDGPKSIEDLAHLTSSHPDSLYRVLHLLAGFGLFEEASPGVFANTEDSRLLIKTNPDTLHGGLPFFMAKIFTKLGKSFPVLFRQARRLFN